MTSANQLIMLFLSSFTCVAILTPLMRKIAFKVNFLDNPNSTHKTHDEPIPYLGGVAIILGICITIYLALLTQSNMHKDFWLATSILLPAVILGLVGLVDDYYSLSPFPRFIFQTLSGIFTATLLIQSDTVGNPTGNSLLDAAITVFWIVGITNSINFFDNLDGGAAGTVAVTSLGLLVITLINGQVLVSASSTVILAAMLSFLIWNRSPARIYMGDAGSLFLGTMISVLTIRLNPEAESQAISLLIPLLLLAIPILDTSVAVASRVRRRISVFQGGLDHLSHRLIRMGATKKQTFYILCSLSVIFAGLATILATPNHGPALIPTIALVFWVILFAIFLKMDDVQR